LDALICRLVWALLIFLIHNAIVKYLPDADPYLFPAAALLSGWGLLTIWRLDPRLGARQAIWLDISLLVFLLGLRLPASLMFLRRYKYVLLTGSMLVGLAAGGISIGFGHGYGRLRWFIFPLNSETSAYRYIAIPGRSACHSLRVGLFSTFIVSSLAVLLLLVQRSGHGIDIHGAYTIIIYLARDAGARLISTPLMCLNGDIISLISSSPH
jgi:hypothetical protein